MISKSIQPETLFKDFLSLKTGNGNSSSSTHSFGELFTNQLQKGKQNKSLSVSSVFNGLKMTTGNEFLESMKQYIQATGLKLDQISAGQDSLAVLKKILLYKGFDRDEVNSLFDQLQTTVNGKQIKLSDLYAKLRELNGNKEEEELSLLFPSSSLPFFKTLLPLLGLDEQTMESSLSYAKTQGGNINLERLVSFLKGLGTIHTDTGEPKQLPDNVTQILKSMGIPVVTDKETKISLSQFVSRLEIMLYENASKGTSETHFKNDLIGFLKNLNVNHVFSDNHLLTENLTRLKSTNPLEASKYKTDHKSSLFSRNEAAKSPAINNEHATEKPYDSLNHENPFQGKNLSSLLDDTADQNKENLLKSSIQEQFEKTMDNENGQQEIDAALEVGFLGSDKKETHSVANSTATSEKSLPAYVMNQVSKQILRSFQDGLNEIRLQLKPPHLGRIQLHLKNENDGLKVSILAENNTTQKLLKTHTSELKAALLEHGIRLEKIDVQVSFNFDQSMSQAKQDSRKAPHKNELVFSLDNKSETAGFMAPQPRDPLIWRNTGTLDLVA
jgi:flagellar hook-length control protein FliK